LDEGGGIFMENASLTIENSGVKSNLSNKGGGICALESCDTLILLNCSISNNEAEREDGIGGGILSRANFFYMERCSIVYNIAYHDGAGISIYGEDIDVYIKHNWFIDNVCNIKGGAIYSEAGSVTIEGNLFLGNRAPEGGASIQIETGGRYTKILVNTIVGDSTADSWGIINLQNTAGSSRYPFADIIGNIIDSIWGYCIKCGGQTGASILYNLFHNYSSLEPVSGCEFYRDSNLVDVDPIFVGGGDFHLQDTSPAVDTLRNCYWEDIKVRDIDNNPRFINGDTTRINCGSFYAILADLGAYETEGDTLECGDVNNDCYVNTADLSYLAEYVFYGGPPPCPYLVGDVNGDCDVNSADVSYLQNYLFYGGPPPQCTCSIGGSSYSGYGSGTGVLSLSGIEYLGDGIFEVSISLENDVPVSVFGLEISYSPQIEVIEPVLTQRVEGMELLYKNESENLTIGLVDLDAEGGVHYIEPGSGEILSLKVRPLRGAVYPSSFTVDKIELVDNEALFLGVSVTGFTQGGPQGTYEGSSLEFSLNQNVPNPFTSKTVIGFVLPEESDVRIDVYNVGGQRIKTLLNRRLKAGHHTVLWDGRDISGNLVPPGVYFYRIETGKWRATGKAIKR